MEESTKKIFKPKFELVQECNGLVSIHLQARCCGYTQGTEITGTTQEDHQMLVCRQLLTLLPLTHWELGLKTSQDKARNLYIILSDSLRGNIQTLFGGKVYPGKKGRLSYQFCTI
jgi:hypothetical protein